MPKLLLGTCAYTLRRTWTSAIETGRRSTHSRRHRTPAGRRRDGSSERRARARCRRPGSRGRRGRRLVPARAGRLAGAGRTRRTRATWPDRRIRRWRDRRRRCRRGAADRRRWLGFRPRDHRGLRRPRARPGDHRGRPGTEAEEAAAREADRADPARGGARLLPRPGRAVRGRRRQGRRQGSGESRDRRRVGRKRRRQHGVQRHGGEGEQRACVEREDRLDPRGDGVGGGPGREPLSNDNASGAGPRRRTAVRRATAPKMDPN